MTFPIPTIEQWAAAVRGEKVIIEVVDDNNDKPWRHEMVWDAREKAMTFVPLSRMVSEVAEDFGAVVREGVKRGERFGVRTVTRDKAGTVLDEIRLLVWNAEADAVQVGPVVGGPDDPATKPKEAGHPIAGRPIAVRVNAGAGAANAAIARVVAGQIHQALANAGIPIAVHAEEAMAPKAIMVALECAREMGVAILVGPGAPPSVGDATARQHARCRCADPKRTYKPIPDIGGLDGAAKAVTAGMLDNKRMMMDIQISDRKPHECFFDPNTWRFWHILHTGNTIVLHCRIAGASASKAAAYACVEVDPATRDSWPPEVRNMLRRACAQNGFPDPIPKVDPSTN